MSTAQERQLIYGTRRWWRLRVRVIQRDGGRCCKCEKVGGSIEVHHIVPIKEGGPVWKIDNLESLCRLCHIKKHRPPVDPVRKAWDRLIARELDSVAG